MAGANDLAMAFTAPLNSRRRVRAVQAALGLLFVLTLIFYHDRIVQSSISVLPAGLVSDQHDATPASDPPPPVEKPKPAPVVLSQTQIDAYVDAILRPEATHLPRLQCPPLEISASRYAHLIPTPPPSNETHDPPIQYFIALDLRNVLPLLPRLLGSILETISFLGPANCFLSIVEGHSPDGTLSVLSALATPLAALGTRYHLESSSINPSAADRINRLAALRNLALAPLLANPDMFAPPAAVTILFLNDVALCAEDVLELAHQRRVQAADMTCGVDWTYAGRDPTFYDVWVARTMRGDTFFDIPPSGSWDFAWNLFWNDEATRARFRAHRPFQVFSCWNGAVAVGGEAVMAGGVRFRGPREDRGECYQGEPQLFCKDLWFGGWGRVAVVPSVNVEYGDEKGKLIKDGKGYTSAWTALEREGEARIEWVREPPGEVKCMPTHDNQYWQAWNESLPL
ncbi:glycosyltransferase [Podospora conica]|nr:glycosyltransferase [Schizothecium conicum]